MLSGCRYDPILRLRKVGVNSALGVLFATSSLNAFGDLADLVRRGGRYFPNCVKETGSIIEVAGEEVVVTLINDLLLDIAEWDNFMRAFLSFKFQARRCSLLMHTSIGKWSERYSSTALDAQYQTLRFSMPVAQ